MSILITFLQILGLIVLALIVLGFATRMSFRRRSGQQATRAARRGEAARYAKAAPAVDVDDNDSGRHSRS